MKPPKKERGNCIIGNQGNALSRQKIEHLLKIFVRTDGETDKNIGINNNPYHKSSFNDAMSASCSAAVMPRVAASCCNFLAINNRTLAN